MTVVADVNGHLSCSFTIPSNIPAGSKKVQLIGRGGTTGTATFVGQGQITALQLREVENVTINQVTTTTSFVDPLAETFVLPVDSICTGADLWFEAKGAAGNKCFCQLREVSLGLPTRNVIASQIIDVSTVTLGGWWRFSWPPVMLSADTEYALVIGADDAISAVSIGAIGQFDAATQQWVTSQPYQIGTLFSSSNGSTWTPQQDRDLKFRIIQNPFSATTTTVSLPDFTITAVDELIIKAATELMTSDCEVTFTLSLPDGSTITIEESQRVVLTSTMTGTVHWYATLTGSAAATPRLAKDFQIITASRSSPATYITRAIPAGTGVHVSIYLEQYLPGAATIAVDITANDGATWTNVPVVSGLAVGDGWFDMAYKLTSWTGVLLQARVTLTGDARNRPAVRHLRVVIT